MAVIGYEQGVPEELSEIYDGISSGIGKEDLARAMFMRKMGRDFTPMPTTQRRIPNKHRGGKSNEFETIENTSHPDYQQALSDRNWQNDTFADPAFQNFLKEGYSANELDWTPPEGSDFDLNSKRNMSDDTIYGMDQGNGRAGWVEKGYSGDSDDAISNYETKSGINNRLSARSDVPRQNNRLSERDQNMKALPYQTSDSLTQEQLDDMIFRNEQVMNMRRRQQDGQIMNDPYQMTGKTNPNAGDVNSGGGYDAPSQDMTYVGAQHPANYEYNTALPLRDFMNSDYRARQMDNIANKDAMIYDQLEAYRGLAQDTVYGEDGMYDTGYINQKGQALDNLSNEGYQRASQGMNNMTQQSADNYGENLNQSLDRIQGASQGAQDQIGQGVDRFRDDAFSSGMNFDSKTRSAGRDFADTQRSSAQDFSSGVGGVADQFGNDMSQIGGQFVNNEQSNADMALGTQQNLYDDFANQSQNSNDLMNRMSSKDYSSDLLNRRMDQTSDDIQARMNAMGLGRSGATAEALSEARANLVAQQTDADWNRDAQLADMTGRYGMSGAGQIGQATERYADRMTGANQAQMQTDMMGEDARFKAGLSGQEQMLQGDRIGADAELQASGRGNEAMLQADMAGASAGLEGSNRMADIDYQSGMTGANQLATASRDIYGTDAQNIGRQIQMEQGRTAQLAGNADALYSDLYQNQQNQGATGLDLNRNILQNQIARANDYYSGVRGLDEDVTKANAQAMQQYNMNRANLEQGFAGTDASLFQNQSNNYAQQASGLYDLSGTMAMSGLTNAGKMYMAQDGYKKDIYDSNNFGVPNTGG